ncbi:MAG: peptide ABC transporter substrate-binding protein [Oscillospiraceae bacterium]|nr:peptide ABC transporter substrate-binding protein [Oscillospiraceae bacterium]
MKRRNRLIALTLTLVMSLSLAACGGDTKETPGPDASGDPQTNKVVYRTLYNSEVDTLNYLSTSAAKNTAITYNLVDCLVEYDAYGNVEPALALSWEPNADATVWTFHLRQGVKWVDKDGKEVHEVTAHDFVTSARYVCDARNDSSNVSTYRGIVANAREYYNYTAYLLALENAVDGTDENGNPAKFTVDEDGNRELLEPVDEVSVESVGVKAVDDYTLEYTLTGSRPYFISMVSFGSYMPAYEPFLTEKGKDFGTDNANLLYCGPYILSTFKHQQERVMTKNASYWEPEQVFIDEIRQTYNAEANSIAVSMYQNGEIDAADIPSELLNAMMSDSASAAEIHPSRPNTSYSYWFLFNFDANFDAEYQPENWNKAVNNENFRLSLVHALNRVPALSTGDPYNPTGNICNTVTPATFAINSDNGKDYTEYAGLPAYVSGDNFDEAKALEYKEKAVAELTAAGATFPIIVYMPYNSTSSSWANECQVVEQQMEGLLGTDYIDIKVEAVSSENFLRDVRRSGKYAFMKCNWGADYADPETWTDPFTEGSTYSFIFESTDPTTQALYAEYISLVDAAKAITNDWDARYEAFAKAETFLLDHGFAIPYSTNASGYSMSKLNTFEGQYAPFGGASQRYKDQHLLEKSMGIDEFNAAYEAWKNHS